MITRKLFLTSLLCLTFSCLMPTAIHATETDIAVTTPTESDSDLPYLIKPYIYDEVTIKKQQSVTFTWSGTYNDEADFFYELQFTNDSSFETGTETFTTAINKSSYTIAQKYFGKNGGKFFLRVRTCYTDTTGTIHKGEWSDTKNFTYVAINKTNFPSLSKLLKEGTLTMTIDGKKTTYKSDKNRDGWLDSNEIQNIWQIETTYTTTGPGKHKPTYTISSLKGIEYLDQLSSIDLVQYSGKTIDTTKNDRIFSLNIRGITAKQITVKSNAKYVSIQAAYDTKLKKLDVSGCPLAKDITAYGNTATKTLKLPKNKKNLNVLSLSDIDKGTLNLNAYKNLQQLYLYSCTLKKLQVNKCKDLRYLYFWHCDNIRTADVRSCKKLRGVDTYKTNCKVKTPKKTKVTKDTGKWWYSTAAYKKDMKNL